MYPITQIPKPTRIVPKLLPHRPIPGRSHFGIEDTRKSTSGFYWHLRLHGYVKSNHNVPQKLYIYNQTGFYPKDTQSCNACGTIETSHSVSQSVQQNLRTIVFRSVVLNKNTISDCFPVTLKDTFVFLNSAERFITQFLQYDMRLCVLKTISQIGQMDTTMMNVLLINTLLPSHPVKESTLLLG